MLKVALNIYFVYEYKGLIREKVELTLIYFLSTKLIFENLEENDVQRRKKKYYQQLLYSYRDHHGRDRMVVGFTTTCAISSYHH